MRRDPQIVDPADVRSALVDSGFLTVSRIVKYLNTVQLEVSRLEGYQSTEQSRLRVDRLTLKWVGQEVNSRVVLDQRINRSPPVAAWALTVGGTRLTIIEPRKLQDDDGMMYTVRAEGTQGLLAYGIAATSEVSDLAWNLVPLELEQDLDAVMRLLPF